RFGAAARDGLRPGGRQPGVPRSGAAELLGGVFGRQAGDRVPGSVGRRTALLPRRIRGPALAPDLGEARSGPVGEGADPVRAGEDRVDLLVRDAVVDVLADLEGGDQVQGQPGEDAERAEPDHVPGKVRIIPGERVQRRVWADKL